MNNEAPWGLRVQQYGDNENWQLPRPWWKTKVLACWRETLKLQLVAWLSHEQYWHTTHGGTGVQIHYVYCIHVISMPSHWVGSPCLQSRNKDVLRGSVSKIYLC
jgi:hypothetical protein